VKGGDGAGQRVQNLTRWPQVATLLEKGVEGRRDGRESGEFLAAQAWRPSPGSRGQPDIDGLQAGAAGAKQIGEFRLVPEGGVAPGPGSASAFAALIMGL